MLSRLSGSAGSNCQTVGLRTDVRAGSLAAGNFEQARQQYADAKGGKPVSVFLYAIPEHSTSMPGVSVTLESLTSGASTTQTFRSVEDAESWKYYPVFLPIPAPGSWRITMTAGPDRGCFQVTFSR